MKNRNIVYGMIGLLVGVVLMGATAAVAVNNDNQGMMKMIGMRMESSSSNAEQSTGHAGMSMNDMTGALKDKRGDDFDKEFISTMIAHHEGAVEMADLAKQHAKHDEIKKLADDITSAQTKEISQMQAWQHQWGYQSTGMSGHNGH